MSVARAAGARKFAAELVVARDDAAEILEPAESVLGEMAVAAYVGGA